MTMLSPDAWSIDARPCGRKRFDIGRGRLDTGIIGGSIKVGPEPNRIPAGGANEFQRLSASTLFVFAMCLTLGACREATRQDVEAKISFTQVPEWNTGDRDDEDVIEGNVDGARQGQQIVLYSKCGELWWLQPLLASPFTAILPGKAWRNEVHLGTEYAALLVDASYRPAAVLRQLPARGGGVAQVAVAHGQKKSSSFFIDFSGFKWRIRWKPSDRGGTSNPYNPGNVYTDGTGALHLQIVKRDQRWTCSEVKLTRSLGYGTYSFTVEDTSRLDPSLAFEMYTWDYSTDEQNNREFDINISRWADPDNKNAEFTLQPTFLPSNVSRFNAPAGKLTHTMIWEPGRIIMTTSRADAPAVAPVVSKRVFTSEVPAPGSESIRMAFFVYSHDKRGASGLQQRTEVVVDRFEFWP